MWSSCCGILTPAKVSWSWAEVVEKGPCGFSSLMTQMQNNPQSILFLPCFLSMRGISVSWLAYSSFLLPLFLSVAIHIFLYLSTLFLTLSLSGFGLWFFKSPCWWISVFRIDSPLDSQCHRRQIVFLLTSKSHLVWFLLIWHCGFRVCTCVCVGVCM